MAPHGHYIFESRRETVLSFLQTPPWHVNQPCRFEINFDLSDNELLELTKNRIKNLPGFKEIDDWRKSHAQSINTDDIE